VTHDVETAERAGKSAASARESVSRAWREHRWRIVVSIGAFALVALSPILLAGSQYILGVLVLTLLFAIWASGWNIISGFAGQFSLGHAVFVGIGAYVCVLMTTTFNMSPILGMFVGGGGAVLVAALLAMLSFRLRGPYYALLTIAFAESFRLLATNMDTVGPFQVGGALGISLPLPDNSVVSLRFTDKGPYVELTLIVLTITLLATAWLMRSRFGLYWAAIRTNEEAAASLGVPIFRYKAYAAMTSGLIVGAGGALYAVYIGYIDPNRVFGLDLSIQIALIGLVGGQATLIGPVIGAFVLYPVGEGVRTMFGATSGADLILYGLLIMLTVYAMPKGFAGLLQRARRKGTGGA
jgi:branched-chain amino acid transport system permease protein